MLRKGRLARLARLGGMATGLVGDVAGAAVHLVHDTTEEAGARLHKRAAERLLRVLGDMKGLPLKAGQMLSYIDEFIPEEHRHIYEQVLGRLQMHTPVMAWEDIQEVFEEEFDGRTPIEVFRSFDPEPVAAASIGQVYKAVLHDGTTVAVKIQYPGVVDALDSDLANISQIAGAVSHLIPKTDFTHLIADVIHKLEDECDYVLEAQSQQAFIDLFADDPQILVPRVFPELSTRRVLTTEFIEATEWADMLQTADDEARSLYGQVIFRFVFESLFRHGLFNGDPHPGNYLFMPDGRITFIDFGCVQRYSDEQSAAFRRLRDGVLAGTTGPALRRLLVQAFMLEEDIDAEVMTAMEDYILFSLQPATAPQPYRFTREYSKELLIRMMRVKNLMTVKLFTGKKAYPLDLERADAGIAFLGRTLTGLASILTTLGSEADFRAIIEATGE